MKCPLFYVILGVQKLFLLFMKLCYIRIDDATATSKGGAYANHIHTHYLNTNHILSRRVHIALMSK